MESVVVGGDAGRHQTGTLSTLYQCRVVEVCSCDFGGWVGVRGRFGWKSDRRQIANRNNRLLGRLHFHTERFQVGRFLIHFR